MGRAHRSPRDFAGYAQLEALNILLVPGIALYFAWPHTIGEAAVLGTAIVATAGFLAIGTFYWRGVAARMASGNLARLVTALRIADSWERPLVAITALASVFALGGIIMLGFTAAIIAALALTVLAWLEYVNYYHWQLQHFDRAADIRRLVSTRRFRRAHMARDLARYRRASLA